MVEVNLLTLIEVCSALVTVSTAAAIVWRMTKPLRDINSKIEELMVRSEKDYRRLERIEATLAIHSKAVVTILLHLEDGNHTGEMNKMRKLLLDDILNQDRFSTR